MTKKEFENALDRSIEAMLDGGQPGIGDILLISKALEFQVRLNFG